MMEPVSGAMVGRRKQDRAKNRNEGKVEWVKEEPTGATYPIISFIDE